MEQSNVTEKFASRLREASKQAGITTPQQLADATTKAGLRVSYTLVYKNWNGSNSPGLLNLIAYAKALNADLHYLITGETEHNPPSKNAVLKMVKELYPDTGKAMDKKLQIIVKLWPDMSDSEKDAVLNVIQHIIK